MSSKAKPKPLEQIISPREAYFAPFELVAAADAVGRISADCLAPCPPGMPVCVPGVRVSADNSIIAGNKYLRVLLVVGWKADSAYDRSLLNNGEKHGKNYSC